MLPVSQTTARIGNKSVEEAMDAVLGLCFTLNQEEVRLEEALGRTLAVDIRAEEDLPPFDRAAMDGYAFRAADPGEADQKGSAEMVLIGSVAAGHIFAGIVGPGTAVGITTGAPMPPGADTVVRLEDVIRRENSILISARVPRGTNVSFCGEDIAVGTVALKAGLELTPPRVGVLAALGIDPVPVVRQPRVAIIGTGDELVELGQPLAPGKIRNSNYYSLASLVHRAGGLPRFAGLAPDRLPELVRLIREARGADIILTTGGASVGEYDLIKPALDDLGAEVIFWRVRMKPGTPMLLALWDRTIICGLSGNPAAAMTSFELFIRPAIRKLSGLHNWERIAVEAVLSGEIRARGSSLRRFIRAETWVEDGRYRTRATGSQKSGILSSMAAANSLIVVPEGTESLADGSAVRIVILDEKEMVQSDTRPIGGR